MKSPLNTYDTPLTHLLCRLTNYVELDIKTQDQITQYYTW